MTHLETGGSRRRVLVLCPTAREYRDLPALARAHRCELVFDEFGGDYFDRFLVKHPPADIPPLDILALIDETVARHAQSGLNGVTSGVGYPGMSGASIIARRLGLPGPTPESVMRCDHKYYSRLAQKRFVPEAVPWFQLLDGAEAMDEIAAFPMFVKPVKSCMSINARRVDDREQLRRVCESALLAESFVRPFNDMLGAYTDFSRNGSYLLAESLLEGRQVSLEGYVFDGEVHVMGVLDAIVFPGTISFERFQYPSGLDESVRERMAEIARRLLNGIGYDNAPFNIEMFYDERNDRIRIIEVNPKLASQFADLFEKVDGQSSFAVLLELALGERPAWKRRQGRFAVAATCVLRAFEDRRVVAVPPSEAIEAVVAEHPDAVIEIHATCGRNLSDQMQDAQSFRYGLVNIGADSKKALDGKLSRIRSRLHFEFAPAG